MAETKDLQRSRYPLPAYNFRVTIKDTPMSFSQVSGLVREHETVTYRHGFSYWEGEDITAYHLKKYAPVTFKKGTVKGITFLYDWLRAKEVRPIDISLCDESGQLVLSWRIAKALPVKLEAPTFDATTNEVSIESLEVMAADISIEYH